MAQFKIQLLTFQYNNNNKLAVLNHMISNFKNIITTNSKNENQITSNLGYCYSFDEKISLKENSQKSLNFSMLKNITRENRIEQNPFVNELKIGSQLLLEDKYNNQFLFTVIKINFDFKDKNIIYHYECQDSFTYNLSRQNAGYKIENDPSKDSFLGAHDIDWWVTNKIDKECHITYTYLSLADRLIIRDKNNNNQVKIPKPAYNYQEHPDFFKTFSFSGSGTANSILIQLGDMVGLQLNTYEELVTEQEKEYTYNVLKCYYWFSPKKTLAPSGLKYSPNREIKDFSLAHEGTTLTSILNVTPIKRGEKLLTLLPSVPQFFKEYFMSDEWETTTYYNGFYSDLCSNHLYLLNNYNKILKPDIKEVKIENGLSDLTYDDQVHFYSGTGKKGLLCIPLQCLQKKIINKKIKFFLPSTLYNFFNFSNDNKDSYLEYKRENVSQLLYNVGTSWKLWLPEEPLNSYIKISEIQKESFQSNVDEIPDLKRKAALNGAFVIVDTNESFSNYIIQDYQISWKWYRNPTQEEIDFAYIADHCPWLENKLINFDYFRQNHIITTSTYQQIINLFNNTLRIINGRLLCYNDLYYHNLQTKTERLGQLKSDIDNLGAFFQNEYIDSFINNGIVRDNSHFVEQYEHMFGNIDNGIIPDHKYLMDYDKIYSKYLNQYIDAEQRFLKNMYEFQQFFNAKNHSSTKLYKYKASIQQSISNPTEGAVLYSFNQGSLSDLKSIDSDFKLYIQDKNNDDYGKPLVPIYFVFDNSTLRFSTDQILWKSKFNSNYDNYWIIDPNKITDVEKIEDTTEGEEYYNPGPYNPDLTYFKQDVKTGKYIVVSKEDMIQQYKNREDIELKDFYFKKDKTLQSFNFQNWSLQTNWLISLPQAKNLPYDLTSKTATAFYYKHVPITTIYYKYEGPSEEDPEKNITEYWPTILITSKNAREFFRPVESNEVIDGLNKTQNLNEILTQIEHQKGLIFKKEGYTVTSLNPSSEGYELATTAFQDFPTDNKMYYTSTTNPNLNLLTDEKLSENETKEYITTFLHTTASIMAQDNNKYYYSTYYYKPLRLNEKIYKNRKYVICLNLTENDVQDIAKVMEGITSIDMVKYYPLRTKCTPLSFKYFDQVNAPQVEELSSVLIDEGIINPIPYKNTINAKVIDYIFHTKDQLLNWMIMEVVDSEYEQITKQNQQEALSKVWFDNQGYEIDLTKCADFTKGYYVAKDLKDNIFIKAPRSFNLETQYYVQVKTTEGISYKKIWTVKNMMQEAQEGVNVFQYQDQYIKILYLPKKLEPGSIHNILLNKYTYQDNRYIFEKKEYKEFKIPSTNTAEEPFKLELQSDQINIEASSNGAFWYLYHNHSNEAVRLEAIRIETELNSFWERALSASKQCNYFLPTIWQSYRDYQLNPFFKDLFSITTKEDKGQKVFESIAIKHTFIPKISLLKRPHYTFIYTKHQSQQDPLTEAGEEMLTKILIDNSYLAEVFHYLIPNIDEYQHIQAVHNTYKDAEAYYTPQDNTGCSWASMLESLSETGEKYKYFGGWNDMMIKMLQYSGYINLSNTGYEEYKNEHDGIWDNIYSTYPNIILEKQYEPDESAVNERDILTLSLNAIKDYSNIERKYNISLIDSASIRGYIGQELKIGECIELEADALYPEWDDVKNSLRQYLFITELSYPLRNDGDITLTVDDIKYQDKLIRDLVKLIR